MKLIKELGVRNNGKRGYMWALFECPKCGKQIERMKHQGVNQEQCQECFREYHKQTQIKHGDRYSRLYRTWTNMRARCTNPNEVKYKLYGARGITICKEWDNYEVFKTWALTNGYTDTLTIDRIDVNGNYEPGNIQFITNKENAGKDKIVISETAYHEIVADIQAGTPVKTAYEKRSVSRGAYYNAKKRYTNV